MSSMVFGHERFLGSIWQSVKAPQREDEKQTLSFLVTFICNEKAMSLVAQNCDFKSLYGFYARTALGGSKSIDKVRILLEHGASVKK